MTTEAVIEKLLFSRELPLIGLTVAPGSKNNFKWIVGHSLAPASPIDYGPRRKYKAMIVTKCASRQDVNGQHYMLAPAFQKYKEFLRAAGMDVADAKDVYVTGMLKTTMLKMGKSLPKRWIDQQSIFLKLEILLTRPDVILMMGREVCDFFFPKMKLSSGEGRWHEYILDTTSQESGLVSSFKTNVLASASPAVIDIEETPESIRRLASSAKEFVRGLKAINSDVNVMVKDSRYYPVLNTVDEVVKTFNEIAATANRRLVSVDAEWQGRSPQNKGSFIRCVQFGWDRGKAVSIKLTDTEGRPTFVRHGDREATVFDKHVMYGVIEEYFKRYSLRPAGFFFQSDNEWLSYDGLDLLQFFTCPDSPEKCRDEGGFGLDLAVLAYDELMSNELEMIRRFFTDVPDYYSGFEAKRVELGKSIPKAVFDAGFGWIPDEVLLPYAGGDADVQITASLRFCETLLDRDAFGNSLWLPFWHSTQAVPVASEIMRTGMPFNSQRALDLAKIYAKAVDIRKEQLAEAFNWPDFPIDTWQQLNTAIYGPKYSGYVDKMGKREDRRPPGAKSLMLEPVLDNGDTPMAWARVKALGRESQSNPSSGLKALGIMQYSESVAMEVTDENGAERLVNVPPPPELKLIADTKILRQVQKNFVGSFDLVIPGDKKHKLPAVVTGYDPIAGFAWSGGYPELVSNDNYIRCFISTVKETARWSASRPNLHNSPNKAEGLYAKILGKLYPGFIRTMFEAPEGYVIVETDLASAELFMLAMASGDPVLWDHCTRNLLPEDDPMFVDPHSRLCVDAFNFKCAPTKAGLKSIDMEHIRNVGKCIAAGEFLWTNRGPLLVEHMLGDADADVDLEPTAVSFRGYTKIEAVEYAGELDCVTIFNSLGGEMTVSEDHKSFVVEPDGSIVVKEARDTVFGDQMLVNAAAVDWAAVSIVPTNVREALSQLFLSDYVYSETGSGEFSANGCFLLGLIRSKAVKRSSQELILSVVESVKEPNAAETILRVAAILTEAVVPRYEVLVDGKNGEISIKGPKVSEVLDKISDAWPLLPNFVLRMNRKSRLAYLSGLSAGRVRGVRQGMCVLVDESIVRKFRVLMQSCGFMVIARETAIGGKLIPMDAFRGSDCAAIQELRSCLVDVSRLMEVTEHEPVFTRFYERLTGELPEERRIGLAAKIGYTFKRGKGETRSKLVSMINELVDHITSTKVDVDDADFDFLELASVVLNSERLQVATVVEVEDAGTIPCYDVQTTPQQKRALMCGDGVVTHNSVIYGWAYGRQAEAIVMGAKELGITVSLEDARRLLDYLPKQYVNGGVYLQEAAACVDRGYLTMPLGRIRRAPRTNDKSQRSAYMREFMNAPIQGGVADVINIIAGNIRKLRTIAQMRFHIMLQMHDAFYFLVPIPEVTRLCTEIIPRAIVNMTPIVPFSLSGVRSKAEPRYMGFNIAIMKRWKEKVDKAEYKSWLYSLGIDYTKIPRLEI